MEPHHALDAFFAEHIPLTQAMGLTVAGRDAHGLRLSAPLAPNVNDKGTAFAGSLAAIVTLAGWSLTTLVLREANISGAQVAIGHAETAYLRPVRTTLLAECAQPPAAEVERFLADFRARGKARWDLEIVLRADGLVAVHQRARYHAWRTAGTGPADVAGAESA